jgi:DNA-binding NtrC family response regulator
MRPQRPSPVVRIDQAPPEDFSAYRPAILVVDDESAIADTLTEILSRNGYSARAAYDGADALESVLVTPPEMLIADVILPGMSGVELAIQVRRIYPECKILLFSGQASTADLLASARREGHHFTLLAKPVHPRDLLKYIADALENQVRQAHPIAP